MWSGVASASSKPSLASASAAGAQNGGANGTVVAGIAILGLGLAGLMGGALVTAGNRRRAGAKKH